MGIRNRYKQVIDTMETVSYHTSSIVKGIK